MLGWRISFCNNTEEKVPVIQHSTLVRCPQSTGITASQNSIHTLRFQCIPGCKEKKLRYQVYKHSDSKMPVNNLEKLENMHTQYVIILFWFSQELVGFMVWNKAWVMKICLGKQRRMKADQWWKKIWTWYAITSSKIYLLWENKDFKLSKSARRIIKL